MGLDLYMGKRTPEGASDDEIETIAQTNVHLFGTGYGTFAATRRVIADMEGIDLDTMDGFGGTKDWDEVDSPIKPLLNHSDCDGHLTRAECAAMTARMQEINDLAPGTLPELIRLRLEELTNAIASVGVAPDDDTYLIFA